MTTEQLEQIFNDNSSIAGYNIQAMTLPKFIEVVSKMLDENKQDFDFIESALNHYWNDAHTNLERKDLGDLEKRMYEKQRDGAKAILDKIGA